MEEEASFVSGHASRVASMLIFSSYEVRVRACTTQLSNFKLNTWKRGSIHSEHSTDEGHSPETSGHMFKILWHFQQHCKLYFFIE